MTAPDDLSDDDEARADEIREDFEDNYHEQEVAIHFAIEAMLPQLRNKLKEGDQEAGDTLAFLEALHLEQQLLPDDFDPKKRAKIEEKGVRTAARLLAWKLPDDGPAPEVITAFIGGNTAWRSDSSKLMQIAEAEFTKARAKRTKKDAGKAKGKGKIARRNSDVELARYVRRQIAGEGGEVVAAEGALWRLVDGVWCRADDNLIDAVANLDGMDTDEGRLDLTEHRINSVVRLTLALDRRDRFFAQAPMGVAVGDEFVTVDGAGNLHREPLRPEHAQRFRIDAVPGDLEKEPRLWFAMLTAMLSESEINGDVRDDADEFADAIGECIGMALLGRGAEENSRHLLLVGPPNAGKSSLLKIIASLAPPEARTAMTLHDSGDRFRAGSLIGARMVLCAELPERDLVHVERAKAVLTGDDVQVEKKHRDPVSINPRAGWFVGANALPPAIDSSHALFRRFLVVELQRTFAGGRSPVPDIIANERGAIIGWALRLAAKAIKRGGRTVPAEALAAAEEWAETSDSITAWLASRTDFAQRKATPADFTIPNGPPMTTDVAWRDYRDYVVSGGGKPLAKPSFRRRLRVAGVRGARGIGGGLALALMEEPSRVAVLAAASPPR